MRNKIKKLSFSIFEQLSLLMYGKIEKDRYLDHFNLLPKNIENSILIVGINPSSTDLTQGRIPDPCYIHYIDAELRNKTDEIRYVTSTWNHAKGGKRFCYPGYFSRIYGLFSSVNLYPLFVSKTYNRNWLQKTTNVEKIDKVVLKKFENKDINDFIIIQDLIPIKETNSKKIFDILQNNPKIINKLNDLLELKVNYLKPAITIIFMKKAEEYFLPTIKKVATDIVVYPFIKYLSLKRYLIIKKEIEIKIGREFMLPEGISKWDFVEDE